jgi:Na+/H+ antiporter NhaD/arsenite permease-like protein
MQEVIATLIFVVSLVAIFAEWFHRTVIAIAGAILMIVAGKVLGFYTEGAALEAVDFNTIGLLLGMMIVVALLEPTGFFEYLALWAGRASKGRPLRVFLLLGVVTSVLSMFLDNVTTVVVIAPVTLVIARVLEMEATPLLIAEAMLSNVGGIATLVGDPPNILIGSAADLSFNDFLTHSLPVVIVLWFIAVLLLRYQFREHLVDRPGELADALRLHPAEALKQPREARRILIVLGLAVVMFLLEEPLDLSPALIAMGAAGIALFVVGPDVHETLKRVEWSVLLFFSALFVMVGGLEAAGVLGRLADWLGTAAVSVNPYLLGVAVIWVVAVLSAVIDNVPITIAVIPIVAGLEAAGVKIEPLWWALALGAGLGGNATVIGATANIVVVSVSERSGTPIRSSEWLRYGIPMMLVTCTAASILYVLLYPLLSR